MLAAYRQHTAERAALGIPALPLSAKQVAELIELIKSPPAGEDAFLLELLSQIVNGRLQLLNRIAAIDVRRFQSCADSVCCRPGDIPKIRRLIAQKCGSFLVNLGLTAAYERSKRIQHVFFFVQQ